MDQKYFCPFCFDNKVQKEVISLKFRCGTCYSCPSCKNSLIIRASSITSSQKAAAAAAAAAAANSIWLPANNLQHSISPTLVSATLGEETTFNSTAMTPTTGMSVSSQSQKVYYLICGFCRWSSRDVGISDATTSFSNLKNN
jgi:dynactin-4